MKITRETPSEMVLDSAPWLLSLALVGLILFGLALGWSMVAGGTVLGGITTGGAFALVGGGALAAFAERTQLWLSRPEGTLTFRRRTLFGQTEVSHPLTEVSYATVQTTKGSKGNTLRRGAVLLAGNAGQIALTQSYTSGRGPERAVAAINRWLSAKA